MEWLRCPVVWQVMPYSHDHTILLLTVPSAGGSVTWQLKAEKGSDAWVWLAVITQSNKIWGKKKGVASSWKQKQTAAGLGTRQQLTTCEEEDYEI